ncbi:MULTISPECIES: type II toxin-antitoxin system VapC family toxin [Aphanizomenon]|uniref:type II toxin-antitoxin system VapC family toxin n=1 Tax=Aphanizomenon TaxID=1175 RepID=UPI0005425BD0|nr:MULTISPECIES: type II toxin-antitoxin system VapC family toxin [Aphanizomenon]KHG40109.1 hypothetical protein OA07_19515 [Aphanizomenon flos-aquae 2012/KM1/D3]MTJ32069.1 type II toxin-antitoxin system VapC family toxin [Aphanizomenon sp. UHCC 0183]QSV73308.1 MAG: type II toxin-antitoxin system VapC family toxin [Aphanizomenon flos-aquae KM1D3_PB]
MNYLLDTDTCIYWIKNINSVRDKIQQIGWEQISICNITVAELYLGAYNSQKVADFDLLIASVAITRNHILATNNTRHYSRISEIKLENLISA